MPNLLDNLVTRAQLIQAIRYFFHDRDFLEIDTPVRIPCPALEDYIDAIPAGKTHGEKMFLRTSPELHLKRLMADLGYEKLFQIGPRFRTGEIGSRHLEEFTMLEWYRAGADYMGILDDTIAMIRTVAHKLNKTTVTFRGHSIDFLNDWETLTVEDAFLKYANCSVHQAIADDLFEEILCEKIEPNLGLSRPTVLIDYPASMAALARLNPQDLSVAERWELYMGGLEIANCYSELTNVSEQQARFEATAKLRANDNREVYPIDQAFMKALPNLPETGGIALGIDRLCMILTNSEEISQVTFR